MRPHDVEFGWFAVIAQRHGKHSGEIQQATQLKKQYGQLFFSFHPELEVVKTAAA